jgi:hypothetical protein
MAPPPFRLYCNGSLSGYVSSSSSLNQYHPISNEMIQGSIINTDGNIYELTIVPVLMGHGAITLVCDSTYTLTTSFEGKVELSCDASTDSISPQWHRSHVIHSNTRTIYGVD